MSPTHRRAHRRWQLKRNKKRRPPAVSWPFHLCEIRRVSVGVRLERKRRPVPHKDFSDLYEKMSGKAASASEAHPSR